MATARYAEEGALAVITLDDPATRNALGPETAEAVLAFAQQAAANPAVRLLALTGADGVFCSGAAIRAWEELDPSGETLTDRGTALCDALATEWRSTEPRPQCCCRRAATICAI